MGVRGGFHSTNHTSLMRSLLLTGYPPWRNALALFPRAHDVRGRGGFRFPWLGIWTRRSVLAQPDASPAEVWCGYYANPERLDLLLLAPLASGRMRADFLPEHVERLLHWVDASSGWTQPRTAWRRWQLGRPCWREPAYEPVLGLPVGGAVGAGRALWHWLGGLAGGVEFFPTGVRPLLFFLRLPLATAVQYARTAAAILGLAAASAMAQEHGIYARMAMEGAWTPESALDKASAARVQEWRRERGLLDFAFAFSTYEQAKLQGGFGLAGQLERRRRSLWCRMRLG